MQAFVKLFENTAFRLRRTLATCCVLMLVSACSTAPPEGLGRLAENKNYRPPSGENMDLSSPRERADERFVLSKQNADSYEYRIGAYDVLEIEVFQVEELARKARVNSRGRVSVPLIGSVQVGDLTVEQAEDLIARKLSEEYLQNPHVSIFVSEYQSQNFTVEGMVKDPGVFPIKGPTTLLLAVAMADGLERLADPENMILFRTDKQGRTVGFLVDINRLRRGEVEDPILINGDMIIVPRADDKAMIEDFARTFRGFVGFGVL